MYDYDVVVKSSRSTLSHLLMSFVSCLIFSDYMSSSVRRSVCRLSVTFAHATQVIEIFGNVSKPFFIMAISDLSIKILRRSSQGNPPSGVERKRGSQI